MNQVLYRITSTFILLIMVTLAMAVDGVAGPFKVSVSTNPSVVPVGRAKILVKVSDSQGKLVQDATVRVFARMRGMNMGEREEVAIPTASPGVYSAAATFAMAGQYEVTVSVSTPAGSGQTILQLSTGQDSASSRSSSSVWVYGIAGLALIGIVLWRMRKTGQRLNLRGTLNRSVALSLGLLAAALLAGSWAVRTFRREGAMTPLEAQVMEMNTPAPEGALPVTTAEVQEEPFSASISFFGQVVGYVEQDVVPRVSGTIITMPVYVGDKVKKGQLLAKLDASQIDPMVSEKTAGLSNVSQGVSVANSEYEQSLNMVEQARAEGKMAESEVQEAKSMLDSAKASRSSLASAVEVAAAEKRSAQAELDSAAADRTYQRQELERMRQLFARGAVSKDEWQIAVSTSQKAEAAWSSANEGLAKADSMLSSARTDVKAADADVAAAVSRLTRAEANHLAKLAQVKTALSGVVSARAKLAQSRAAVAEASAALKGATTQRGYTELRAEVDGVITQRLVSPGVVVAPGQPILRVAQVSPIRIQANVPQQDLARVKIGDSVRVRATIGGGEPLDVRVTSVSPAVDPASRMGVVEATYANKDRRFSPGQSVSLEVFVEAASSALVVPAAAVVTNTHGGRTVNTVWVVSSGSPGRFTASQREVVIRGTAEGTAAIGNGLKPGESVVVSPFGLTEGIRVKLTSEPKTFDGNAITVEITAAGYTPESIQIPASRPVKLVFLRRVEATCATAVEFPELGIRAETPLNKPVTVEIPAQRAGKEIIFACPMNMYTGKVVVK